MAQFISTSTADSPSEPKRSRAWLFTLNNYTELQRQCLIAFPFATYTIVGEEISPTTNTPHLQGYVYLPTMKSIKQMRDVCQCHWTIAKGTPQQNQTYCSKEGRFVETGKIPASQSDKGKRGADKIKEMWALAKAGRLEDLPPGQVKTWEYIHMRYGAKVSDRPILDNLWICGPTGCGKSRRVRETHSVFYSKPMSKWWDGYAGEDVVLLDDFAPEHGKYLGYYLKIWADHYAFNGEVKGGMLRIRPKQIIITSQYTLAQCFDEPETVSALSRRFAVEFMGAAIPQLRIAPIFNPGPQGCHVPLLQPRSSPIPIRPSSDIPSPLFSSRPSAERSSSPPVAPRLQRSMSITIEAQPPIHCRSSIAIDSAIRGILGRGDGVHTANTRGSAALPSRSSDLHSATAEEAEDTEDEEEPFAPRRRLPKRSTTSHDSLRELLDTPPSSQNI